MDILFFYNKPYTTVPAAFSGGKLMSAPPPIKSRQKLSQCYSKKTHRYTKHFQNPVGFENASPSISILPAEHKPNVQCAKTINTELRDQKLPSRISEHRLFFKSIFCSSLKNAAAPECYSEMFMNRGLG